MEEHRLTPPKRSASTASINAPEHSSTGPKPMGRNNDKENNTMNFKAALRRVSPGLAAATVCVALGVSTNAQVQTRTTTTAGQAETQATVDRATVVSVNGNDLIVKMDDG